MAVKALAEGKAMTRLQKEPRGIHATTRVALKGEWGYFKVKRQEGKKAYPSITYCSSPPR